MTYFELLHPVRSSSQGIDIAPGVYYARAVYPALVFAAANRIWLLRGSELSYVKNNAVPTGTVPNWEEFTWLKLQARQFR